MNWEEIRRDYESTDITMKDLADKHGVKPSTLRSRKNREDWQRNATKKVATRRNTNVATQKAVAELQENNELNERQKQFCLLYLRYFNATKAYQEAYDVSYDTANSHGYKLLSNEVIKKELNRLKEAHRSDLYIDTLDIKREWLKQSFADVTDYVDFGTETKQKVDMFGGYVFDENDEPVMETRSFVRLKESAEVDGALIQEVKQGKDGVSVKLYDKQKALQELMKLFEGSGQDGTEITIVDAWGDDGG